MGVNLFIQFSCNGMYLLAGTGIFLVSSFPPRNPWPAKSEKLVSLRPGLCLPCPGCCCFPGPVGHLGGWPAWSCPQPRRSVPPSSFPSPEISSPNTCFWPEGVCAALSAPILIHSSYRCLALQVYCLLIYFLSLPVECRLSQGWALVCSLLHPLFLE